MKKILIYLPSLFTITGVFFSFSSITASFDESFNVAVLFIILAAIFDLLDGKIARITNSQSIFGQELDSLADAVSFAVAPAILVYFSVLYQMGMLGAAICFAYVASGLLRLARYTSTTDTHGALDYFTGLPIPAAGILLASVIWNGSILNFFYQKFFIVIIICAVVLCTFLMVSRVPYKRITAKRKKTMRLIDSIYAVALLVPLVWQFAQSFGWALCGSFTAFILTFSYVFSGLFRAWHAYLFRR